MADQSQQLQQALDLIKSGQREQARALLDSILKDDPNYADAWWAMATAVTSPADMRNALQNVVRINPGYPNAQQMLDQINAQLKPSTPDSSDPFFVPNQPSTPTSAPAKPPTPIASSGSQIGESLDDIFSPLPSGGAASSTPPAGSAQSYPPAAYTPSAPPAYTPPPAPAQPAKRGRSPLLYILIGLLLAVVCVCGGCLLLTGGSFLAFLGNPTGQAVLGTAGAALNTGITLIQAPDRLPTDAANQGTLTANKTQSGELDPLSQESWKYEGQRGEQVTITVTGKASSLDPYIGIYDTSGKLLSRTSTQRTGRTQSLTFTLPDDSTYTILVGGIGGGFGAYDVVVKSTSRQ